MSEELHYCNFCGDIAKNKETVWGYLFWCDCGGCEALARQEIYDGIAIRIGSD